ncbi:hypothetical protein [Phenylobacterium sp.]|jgi:hypothetical protein|uniref:hypothetical protein n=1 Tax=Phenylobacterium sp. TaxID=1871053 RepID=UPI002F3F910C
MHAQPPPQTPPAITAEQQQDLDCVSIGVLFGGGANGIRGGWNSRMARFYIFRLQAGDQSRDWRALVRHVPDDMTYREFMERMAECRARMPAPRPAAPPTTPTAG